jgi:hypothetical protein
MVVVVGQMCVVVELQRRRVLWMSLLMIPGVMVV